MSDTVLTIFHDAAGCPTAVLMSYAEFERLTAAASDDEGAEAAEDLAALRAAAADDDGFRLPLAQASRLAAGENVVKVLREWRQMDQAQLADRLGTTRNYVSQIETGARRGVRKADDFARALGVPVIVVRAYLG